MNTLLIPHTLSNSIGAMVGISDIASVPSKISGLMESGDCTITNRSGNDIVLWEGLCVSQSNMVRIISKRKLPDATPQINMTTLRDIQDWSLLKFDRPILQHATPRGEWETIPWPTIDWPIDHSSPDRSPYETRITDFSISGLNYTSKWTDDTNKTYYKTFIRIRSDTICAIETNDDDDSTVTVTVVTGTQDNPNRMITPDIIHAGITYIFKSLVHTTESDIIRMIYSLDDTRSTPDKLYFITIPMINNIVDFGKITRDGHDMSDVTSMTIQEVDIPVYEPELELRTISLNDTTPTLKWVYDITAHKYILFYCAAQFSTDPNTDQYTPIGYNEYSVYVIDAHDQNMSLVRVDDESSMYWLFFKDVRDNLTTSNGRGPSAPVRPGLPGTIVDIGYAIHEGNIWKFSDGELSKATLRIQTSDRQTIVSYMGDNEFLVIGEEFIVVNPSNMSYVFINKTFKFDTTPSITAYDYDEYITVDPSNVMYSVVDITDAVYNDLHDKVEIYPNVDMDALINARGDITDSTGVMESPEIYRSLVGYTSALNDLDTGFYAITERVRLAEEAVAAEAERVRLAEEAAAAEAERVRLAEEASRVAEIIIIINRVSEFSGDEDDMTDVHTKQTEFSENPSDEHFADTISAIKSHITAISNRITTDATARRDNVVLKVATIGVMSGGYGYGGINEWLVEKKLTINELLADIEPIYSQLNNTNSTISDTFDAYGVDSYDTSAFPSTVFTNLTDMNTASNTISAKQIGFNNGIQQFFTDIKRQIIQDMNVWRGKIKTAHDKVNGDWGIYKQYAAFSKKRKDFTNKVDAYNKLYKTITSLTEKINSIELGVSNVVSSLNTVFSEAKDLHDISMEITTDCDKIFDLAEKINKIVKIPKEQTASAELTVVQKKETRVYRKDIVKLITNDMEPGEVLPLAANTFPSQTTNPEIVTVVVVPRNSSSSSLEIQIPEIESSQSVYVPSTIGETCEWTREDGYRRILVCVADATGNELYTLTLVKGDETVKIIANRVPAGSDVTYNVKTGDNIMFYNVGFGGGEESEVPSPYAHLCFPMGTPVRTDQGDIPIHELIPNKHTIRGSPIVDVSHTRMRGNKMVQVAPHSLGHNYPEITTHLSPEHRIMVDGYMIQAKNLIGEFYGVKSAPYNGEVLYNVLMDKYTTMCVNGMNVETIDPGCAIAKLYTNQCKFSYGVRDKIVAILKECVDTKNHNAYNRVIDRC